MKKTFILFLFSILFLKSCQNKKDNIQLSDLDYEIDSSNILDDKSDSSAYTNSNEIPHTNYSIPTKYSFVAIYTKDQYSGQRGIVTTGVFETTEFITEDDKYMILDKAQNESKVYLIGDNVTKRELKTFDSYAEASKAREQLMK